MEELNRLYDGVLKAGFKFKGIMFPDDDDTSYNIEFSRGFSRGKSYIIFAVDFTADPSTDRVYSFVEDANDDTVAECVLFFEDLNHVYGLFNAIYSLRKAGKDDTVKEFFDYLKQIKNGVMAW